MIRTHIATFGLVGTGVIGSGWAARALGRGLDVIATDDADGAEDRLRQAVRRAWPSVRALGLFPGADPDRLRFVPGPDQVAAGADFVQESVPEREDLKRELLSKLGAAAPDDVVIASSSSGLLTSAIQSDCRSPGRVVVGHPFNPVYLLPLVEVVRGEHTTDETVGAACDVYRSLGMHPLVVRREVPGYLADRLQEALWREMLHLLDDGSATTRELDDAIVYGPGLRWSAMGTAMIFHLAGGAGGIRRMLEQFGPGHDFPWTRLDPPELTGALERALLEGLEEQVEGRSIAELEDLRDGYLLAVMRALRPFGLGGGKTIARAEAEAAAANATATWTEGDDVAFPLRLYQCPVEPEWVDYNGHMSESFYLLAFGWASDALFRYIGIDEAYREAGHSFYTVETHVNYLREASVHDPLRFETQLLGVDDKRLHLHHTMLHGDSGEPLATTEQMLVHISGASSAPIQAGPRRALDAIMDVHGLEDAPQNVGRTMGLA